MGNKGRNPRRYLEFFRLDVNTADDSKIEFLEAEYGLIGFAIYIRLLQRVYKEWFFIEYSTKTGKIFAKKNYIGFADFEKILETCLEEGLFSKSLFKKYGVLTSSRIQKNWLHGVAERSKIQIVPDFWLLSKESVEERLQGKFISCQKIGDSWQEIGVFCQKTPHIIEDNIIEDNIKDIPPGGAGRAAPCESGNQKKKSRNGTAFKVPSVEEVKQYMLERCSDAATAKREAESFCDYYEANGWKVGKNAMKNWGAAVRNWMRNDFRQSKNRKGEDHLTVGRHPAGEENKPVDPIYRLEVLIKTTKGKVDLYSNINSCKEIEQDIDWLIRQDGKTIAEFIGKGKSGRTKERLEYVGATRILRNYEVQMELLKMGVKPEELKHLDLNELEALKKQKVPA